MGVVLARGYDGRGGGGRILWPGSSKNGWLEWNYVEKGIEYVDRDSVMSSDSASSEEDEEALEEEEHLALTDSVVALRLGPCSCFEGVIAFDMDLVSPRHTTPPTLGALGYYRTQDLGFAIRDGGARISIRTQAPMPFPSEMEVERLLALPTPPSSPLISLSPPSAEERLARCLAAPALPSSPHPIVPHPYGSPNHVRAPRGFRAAMGRLRASSPSTHHLLHPSPPLPPLPSSLYLPPPVPTSSPLPSPPLPPLLALLFIPPPVDCREDIPEVELQPHKRLCLTALTSEYEVGESLTIATRPTGGHRADYGLIGTLDAETRGQRAEEVGYGIRDAWVDPTKVVEEITPTYLEGVNDRVTELIENNMPPKRTSAAAERLSHNSDTGIRGTVRTSRECTYKDFLNCQPLTFKGIEGVVVLSQLFEKMESVFHISNCATVTQDVAYAMDWETLKKMITVKYCPRDEIKKLEIEL
ncbi:hypothetical protein Tco_0814672 [Tanacetum coccineum]